MNKLIISSVIVGSVFLSTSPASAMPDFSSNNSNSMVKACVSKKTGNMRMSSQCYIWERSVKWNISGPRGYSGPMGFNGKNGQNGNNGKNGSEGKSFYDTWLDQEDPETGNTNREEGKNFQDLMDELRGPAGPQGEPGMKGDTGKAPDAAFTTVTVSKEFINQSTVTVSCDVGTPSVGAGAKQSGENKQALVSSYQEPGSVSAWTLEFTGKASGTAFVYCAG